jgi:hypothetical protein
LERIGRIIVNPPVGRVGISRIPDGLNPEDEHMTQADHDIRLSSKQMEGMFTTVALGKHFAIGVDATDPTFETGMATLLEGNGGLWHACGESFDAAALSRLADLVKATKVSLAKCGKPQGSHKGEHGYAFRSAAPVLPQIAPMPHDSVQARFPHTVPGAVFTMVLGSRGAEDRHIQLCLLAERAGTDRPMVRFGSEWIDDLEEVTAAAQG